MKISNTREFLDPKIWETLFKFWKGKKNPLALKKKGWVLS